MIGLVRIASIVALVGFAASSAFAADPTPEDLAKDLGSPTFAVRDKATKALWKLGEKARPALAEAAKSDDVEVAQRAKEILEKFDWGVFPDTPAGVLALIRSFRGGQLDDQKKAIAQLLKLGDPATKTLAVLLSKPISSENRPEVFDHLCLLLRHEVPALLVAGKTDRAEALLALNALGPNTGGLIDYAVFVYLQGKAATTAQRLEAVRKAGGSAGEAANAALVFVYRAAGDRANALAAAKALADGSKELDEDTKAINQQFSVLDARNVYNSLLEDLGAWDVLSDRIDARVNSHDGLAAYRLRMAGKTKEADEILEKQKDATPGPARRAAAVDEATLALMLNDRPFDGIDRLKTLRTAPHILADLLSSRLDFPEALDLLSNNKKIDEKKTDEATGLNVVYLRGLYGTRKGKLFAQLGQRDAAAQVFAQVAEQLGQRDSYLLTQLIRAEMRAGRYDLACEHFGLALSRNDDSNNNVRAGSGSQDAWEVLFDADADAAAYWWRTLRAAKPGNETPGTTMTRVRNLFIGKATPADLDHAIKASKREVPVVGTIDAEQRVLAIASAYRAAGKLDEAVIVLAELADKILPPVDDPDVLDEELSARRFGRGSRSWVFGIDERFRFWMELGDLLLEQGKPKEAAKRYEQGWKRYPDNPVLMYLSGRALLKAGDDADGRRRIELAHWVGLGNARIRGRFLEELCNRGYSADAKRERDLVRESGWLSELYLGNVWNQVARASVLVKDFDAASVANHRAIHYLLRTPGVAYVEGYAYLTVPQGLKANVARGLLHAGKIPEAMKAARECFAVMPGNIDLAIQMVPELDKQGHKQEADELFKLVRDVYAKHAKDNPESGWAKNGAAWLAAGCQRELDAALASAKRAVELDPMIRSYQETLAEVHFRRGERDKALAIANELVQSDRRSYHYKRQLERYTTAKFDSPLPETDDD